MAQKKKKRKLKKGYRILRNLYAVIVAIAAVIVVGYAVFKIAVPPPEIREPEQTNTEQTEGTAPSMTRGTHQRREQTYTFLLCCPDQASGNADAIMVVTYDVPQGKIGMLSIPRDTLVNTKNHKINSSLHAGVENLREVVSDLVGFPLDYYIEVDLDLFQEIVDCVGGVDYDVPIQMYYSDPVQNLHIYFDPGYQHLTGKEAMELCRFRKNNDGTGYPMGDIQRSETIRNMMVTVAKKAISFGGMTKINEIVDIINRNLETDLSKKDLAWFASKGVSLDFSRAISGNSLPGDGTRTYKNTKWCYELYPEESLAIINEVANPYTTPLTMEDVNIFNPK